MQPLRLLYTALLYLAVPVLVASLTVRGLSDRRYWRRWPERFGWWSHDPEPRGPLVWVHAVSVGEVQAAVPLVHALGERLPRARFLVTTSTPTGSAGVRRALGSAVAHCYAPYDLPGAVGRFLERARPAMAIMMETELWPNVLHGCSRRRIPVLLANARMSGRSAARYRRIAAFMAQTLPRVTCIGAQSVDHARRLVSLGADPERVEVTGSLKFDVRLPASVAEEAQVVRRCFGVDRGVWIAASTHEGEETRVLDAFARVRETVPDCLLVLVPRHPGRFDAVAALCRRRGLSMVRRTDGPADCNGVDVYLGDTMGELPVLYGACDVAFVGGSLVPIGGHNVLEPAAVGVPVVYGPHFFNFLEISIRLTEVGGALQVEGVAQLAAATSELLLDANRRHAMGELGRAFVQENRGALERTVTLVTGLLGGARAESPRARSGR